MNRELENFENHLAQSLDIAGFLGSHRCSRSSHEVCNSTQYGLEPLINFLSLSLPLVLLIRNPDFTQSRLTASNEKPLAFSASTRIWSMTQTDLPAIVPHCSLYSEETNLFRFCAIHPRIYSFERSAVDTSSSL